MGEGQVCKGQRQLGGWSSGAKPIPFTSPPPLSLTGQTRYRQEGCQRQALVIDEKREYMT